MINRKAILVIAVLFLVCSLLYADDPIVYITKTGKKYHTATCSYLRQSKIPIELSEAVERGYTPCSRCDPPTLEQISAPEPSVTSTAEHLPISTSVEKLALPYCSEPAAILHYSGFALLYSEEHEQPYWVAYLLTDNEVRGTHTAYRQFPSRPAGLHWFCFPGGLPRIWL